MKSINVSLISSNCENRFWKWQVSFMAILKYIKSRNANYSDAIDYLLFQYDESTGKEIKDEMGRSLLRDEFYMEGLNCDPMSFDKECKLTNAKFRICSPSKDIQSSGNGKYHYLCARAWIQYTDRIKRCLFQFSKAIRSSNKNHPSDL